MPFHTKAHLQSRFVNLQTLSAYTYTIYLLKSIKLKSKSYIGFTTKKVEDRLQEHNDGLSKYTNIFKPWKLIYFENFTCRACAEKREIFLKSGFGYRLRKLILDNYKLLK